MGTDIARGMAYLHTAHNPVIIHRDLKSGNVLLNEHGVAKIADFGLSRIKLSSGHMTRCGSPLWIAPEVIRGEVFDESCDVYSFAIVLWELLAWAEPYGTMNATEIITQVAHYGLRPEVRDTFPDGFRQLLAWTWRDVARDRPTFPEVLTFLETLPLPA